MAVVRNLAMAPGDRAVVGRIFGYGNPPRVLFNLAGLDSARALLMPALYKRAGILNNLLYATARTNLILQSQAFNDAAWNVALFPCAVDPNAQIDPWGGNSADFVHETAVTDNHAILTAANCTITNATQYTLSIYVQAVGRRYCSLVGDIAGGKLGAGVGFDLQTVSVVFGNGTITSLGDGWFLLTNTETSTGITARPAFCIRNTSGVSIESYAGNASLGYYVWQAQLELGPIATSPILTTASPVTVTDYSVDATGKVTVANAGPAAAILSFKVPHLPSVNCYQTFGVLDGTSVDFSLPYAPAVPAIYANGVLKTGGGVDYTLDPYVTGRGDVLWAVAPAGGVVQTWDGNTGAPR